MALVPAKCTNCDGVLEVNPAEKAAICKHCGSAYIVEEAIKQYNITNVYKIDKASLMLDHKNLIKSRLEAADKQLKYLHDYSKAYSAFKALENDIPEEFRVWEGKITARTRNFDSIGLLNEMFTEEIRLDELDDDFRNAMTTGNEEEKNEINGKMKEMLKQCNGMISFIQDSLVDADLKRYKLNGVINFWNKLFFFSFGAMILCILLALVLNIPTVIIFITALTTAPEITGIISFLLEVEDVWKLLVYVGITIIPLVISGLISAIVYKILYSYEKKLGKIYSKLEETFNKMGIYIPKLDIKGEYGDVINLCRMIDLEFHKKFGAAYFIPKNSASTKKKK